MENQRTEKTSSAVITAKQDGKPTHCKNTNRWKTNALLKGTINIQYDNKTRWKTNAQYSTISSNNSKTRWKTNAQKNIISSNNSKTRWKPTHRKHNQQ
jgi:hypothetical protein